MRRGTLLASSGPFLLAALPNWCRPRVNAPQRCRSAALPPQQRLVGEPRMRSASRPSPTHGIPTYADTYIHMYIHTYMHTCLRSHHTFTCMSACIHIHTSAHRYMINKAIVRHTRLYVRLIIHTYGCTSAHIRAYLCTSVHMDIGSQVHIGMRTHGYAHITR